MKAKGDTRRGDGIFHLVIPRHWLMGISYLPVSFTRLLPIIRRYPLTAGCIHRACEYPHLCKVAPGSLFELD
jgi:hypothetical protein